MTLDLLSDESQNAEALELFEWSSFTSDDMAVVSPPSPDSAPPNSQGPTLAELLGRIKQIVGEA